MRPEQVTEERLDPSRVQMDSRFDEGFQLGQEVPACRRCEPCERYGGHVDEATTTRTTYTCACPPSTNSSIPVIKLLSSEARNTTALAISSGSPSRPSGTVVTSDLTICLLCSSVCPRLLMSGVLVGPGLTALTRIWRACRSRVQLRAKERIAALVALYTLLRGSTLIELIAAFMMIDPPSCKSRSAFCTVQSNPLTLTFNVLSKWASEISPNEANSLPTPALAKTISMRPCCCFTVAYKRSRSARFETSP